MRYTDERLAHKAMSNQLILFLALLSQVTGIPDEQILVAVFPGLPTSAELFILPHKNTTERRKGNEGDLEQVSKGLYFPPGVSSTKSPYSHIQVGPRPARKTVQH